MISSFWNTLGEPTLSDWGLSVTTGIAAITSDRFIVNASDTRISFGGDFSAEGVIKVEGFQRDWAVLIAGNDISHAPFVIRKARRMFWKRKKLSLEEAKTGFKQAYQEELREKITDTFLSKFDMTLEDFKKKGRRELEPNLFQALSFGIKDAKLGCKFLVYGYDEIGQPHLFEVGEGGHTESRDKPGFWAIGSGATSAISMLAYLKHSAEMTPVRAAIYNVLAAKYISEGASDVGPNTFFFIKKYGSNVFSSYGSSIEPKIRKLWEEKGRPSVPQEAMQIVDDAHLRFGDE
jgi:20S proteasome alpha/beta subunit